MKVPNNYNEKILNISVIEFNDDLNQIENSAYIFINNKTLFETGFLGTAAVFFVANSLAKLFNLKIEFFSIPFQSVISNNIDFSKFISIYNSDDFQNLLLKSNKKQQIPIDSLYI